VGHPCEENGFFGWPLVLLTGTAIAWMWRDAVVRALLITMATFAVLSLGSSIDSFRQRNVPGPWLLLEKLPLFNAVTPVRLGLQVTPIVGLLLALGLKKAMAATVNHVAARRMVYAAVAVALVPLVPLPLLVEITPVPAFISSGRWRDYVTEGRSVVTVPVAGWENPSVLRWAAQEQLGFSLAGGYFLGPGEKSKQGRFGPDPRPTDKLLVSIIRTGKAPEVTPEQRAKAREDLKYWRAAVVVLPVGAAQEKLLRSTMTALLSMEPRQIGGVWLWDVRSIVDSQIGSDMGLSR
jgi:hypothetical protein